MDYGWRSKGKDDNGVGVGDEYGAETSRGDLVQGRFVYLARWAIIR